jgi:predicted transcriptional regulator YdeE
MLIGYITKSGTVQTNPLFTTIEIPAQDYRYMTLAEISPETIFGAWKTINHTPPSELARSYGYDLDMYNENHTELTIAVSVKE